MSQENAELASSAFDAFNRRDLDALLALMDDGVEVGSRQVAIEGGYHGHQGLRRWWTDLFAAFPEYTAEVEELRDLGEVMLGEDAIPRPQLLRARRRAARGRGAGHRAAAAGRARPLGLNPLARVTV